MTAVARATGALIFAGILALASSHWRRRTRAVDTGRDLQRGVFAQIIAGRATLGIYAFNPDSGSRYAIVSLGAQF
jgi:hypothetical protein